MTRDMVLMMLPPSGGRRKLITEHQSLTDIKKQIERAHKIEAEQYDKIATLFLAATEEGTLRNLFEFIKLNIRYVEEGEEAQCTKSPSEFLESGEGDCKMMASFIGGVLDALNRKGADFDWYYAFATYPTTEHVFVLVDVGDREYWVDPVVNDFDLRDPEPDKIELKKVGAMALYHISGIDTTGNMPVNLVSVGRRRRVGCDDRAKVSGVKEWVQANPVLAAALVVGVALVLSSGRKKRFA